ncbi:MAG: hypothetical protein ACI8PZ_001684 [Myxococcota bacterium]|jgi:hypothetical protein
MIPMLIAAMALAAPLAPQRDADKTFEGDLKDGTVIDNDWADQSSVACFPGTRFNHFTGKTVFKQFTQHKGEEFIIQVDPADGVNVNVYVMQLGMIDKGSRPPDIRTAWRCSSYYDAPAGDPERLKIGFPNSDMEVVIGVVGATKETVEGAFTVSVWDVAKGE